MTDNSANHLGADLSTSSIPDYQPLIENLDCGLMLIRDGKMLIYNKFLLKILELPTSGIIFNAIIDRLSSTENATARSCVARLSSNTQLGPIQFDLDLPRSGTRTLELISKVIKFASVPTLQVMLRDVTREFEIEMELFETLTMLNSIFDAIDEAIFILDENDLTLRSSNAATNSKLKIDRASYKGKLLWDLISDPEMAKKFVSDIRSELPKSRTLHYNFDMRRGDSVTFPALHTVTCIRDSRQLPMAIMWIISDMSQRVFMKRALAEVENRYRILFDRGGDATFITDTETLQIIDANQAAERQLGYSRNELIGMTVLDISPSSRHAQLQADIALVTHRAGSSTVQGTSITKGGFEIPVQTNMVMTSFGGKQVVIAASRDISAQMERDAERLRLEKLEAVRHITGGIAHEISQPLQGLVTIADLLEDDLTPQDMKLGLTAKIPELVQRISDLLSKMKGIVRLATRPYVQRNDILDFKLSTVRPLMLVVGASEEESRLASRVAISMGIDASFVSNVHEGWAKFSEDEFDILLCGANCAKDKCLEFRQKVRKAHPLVTIMEFPDHENKLSLNAQTKLAEKINKEFFSKWEKK